MSDAINLQDAILSEVRRDKVPVTLFLMNGFQLRGTVTESTERCSNISDKKGGGATCRLFPVPKIYRRVNSHVYR